MIQLLALILLVNLGTTSAIVGFDCSGKHPNVTTFSLLDIGECNYKPATITSTKINVQLLQISEYTNVEIIQCKIEISRTIYRCGMFSHVSAVRNGRADYILDISHKKCKQIHLDGSMTLGNGVYVNDLRVNSTTTRSVTLAGSLDNDGSCKGTQYSDTYGTWDEAIVQASLKITLKQSYVPVKLKTDELILKSATICKYSSGECMDISDGNTFWMATPITKCTFDTYDILFDGLADKITSTDKTKPIIYTVTSQDTTFALTQTEELDICGYRMIRTEHPRLYIIEGTLRIPTRNIQVENLDLFTYVNSKFVYVERHIRMQISTLYDDILLHRCTLERQVLQNAITMATLAPDDFAYNIMKSPGYMAVPAGEVVHIIKCQPVEVHIRKTEHCYNEMPVTHGNHSMFLTPKSRILLQVGSLRECNLILPTMYLLNEQWHKFTPTPIDSMPPKQLQPQSEPTWHYKNPGSLATSGIYSTKDLDNLRNHIMFSKEQPAILNTIIREATQRIANNEDPTLYNIFDEHTLDKIAESTISKFWSGILTFGSVSAAIIAIYIIIRTIMLIINTIVHGYTLHTMYGCSVHILGALCASIANDLIIKGRLQGERGSPRSSNNHQNSGNDIEVVTVSTQSEPNSPSRSHRTEVTQQQQASTTTPAFTSNFQRDIQQRAERLWRATEAFQNTRNESTQSNPFRRY